MPKFTVTHKNLNLRVKDKLQKMPVGAEIELSEEAAKSLLSKSRIERVGQAKTVAVKEGGKAKEKDSK